MILCTLVRRYVRLTTSNCDQRKKKCYKITDDKKRRYRNDAIIISNLILLNLDKYKKKCHNEQ